MSAPRSSSRVTTSVWPEHAAKCSGVSSCCCRGGGVRRQRVLNRHGHTHSAPGLHSCTPLQQHVHHLCVAFDTTDVQGGLTLRYRVRRSGGGVVRKKWGKCCVLSPGLRTGEAHLVPPVFACAPVQNVCDHFSQEGRGQHPIPPACLGQGELGMPGRADEPIRLRGRAAADVAPCLIQRHPRHSELGAPRPPDHPSAHSDDDARHRVRGQMTPLRRLRRRLILRDVVDLSQRASLGCKGH